MKNRFFIITLLYLILSIFVAVILYPHLSNYLQKIIFGVWTIISIILVERLSSALYKKNKEVNNLSAKLNEQENELNYYKNQMNNKNTETNIDKKENKKLKIEIRGKNEKEIFKNILSDLSKKISVVQGIAFKRDDNNIFKVIATYAYYYEDESEIDFEEGNGINGQVAQDKKYVILSDIPDGYMKVYSGLGESYPKHLMIYPIVSNNKTQYVLELAKFEKFSEQDIKLLDTISGKIEDIQKAKLEK